MFQNLVALPHPVGLAAEETCNALPLQKRHLLPAGAVPPRWVDEGEGVLEEGAFRWREISGVDSLPPCCLIAKETLGRHPSCSTL